MVLRFPPQGSWADPIQPLMAVAVRELSAGDALTLTKMPRAFIAWNFSPQKKMKLRGTKDLSIAAVGKYGTLQEFSFFDKVSRRGWPHPARVCRMGQPVGREPVGWGRLGRRGRHPALHCGQQCRQKVAELGTRAGLKTHVGLPEAVWLF